MVLKLSAVHLFVCFVEGWDTIEEKTSIALGQKDSHPLTKMSEVLRLAFLYDLGYNS